MQCRLYLITPPSLDLDSFPALLDKTLAAGDVACLQLRLKQADETPVADSHSTSGKNTPPNSSET